MVKSVPLDSEGLAFIPSFLKGSGPTRKYGILGAILGITLRITKNHIIRATFESLSN